MTSRTTGPDIRRASSAGDLAIGPDRRRFRAIAVAAGLCWSIAFVLVGLGYELQAYADGSVFSYAVAVQDAWAFHWHNISGRLFVYLFCFVPAETYVRLTGDAAGGIALYGFQFYVAPLLGLAATWAADRSKGRIIFGYACVSTACLCPLVFGFPTEMWVAHALFWPALALCHYTPRGIAGTAAVFAVLLALVLSHGGGVVFAVLILLALTLRGWRDAALRRTAGLLLAAIVVSTTVAQAWSPDSYFANVLARAAWSFIDLSILTSPIALLLVAALLGYAVCFVAVSLFAPAKASLHAASITAVALAAYWLWFDHALHAENRYYMRTELFAGAGALGLAAAIHALHADGRLPVFEAIFSRSASARAASLAAQALTGALMIVMLVHAVETAKFVTAWSGYKTAIRGLATGTAADPALGDPRFVSSDRIIAKLAPLSWSSTTQYLSVLLAPGFAPNRLVVDPTDDYFWFSCETATANRLAQRAIPRQSRELIGLHTCLHRGRRVVAGPAALGP